MFIELTTGVVIPQHLGSAPALPDVEKLTEQISEASSQIHTLQVSMFNPIFFVTDASVK